jgi:hypothetical protein
MLSRARALKHYGIKDPGLFKESFRPLWFLAPL